MITVGKNGWLFRGRTETAVDWEVNLPMFVTPEEIEKLSLGQLITLLNPVWWWRAVLAVKNYAFADSIKLSKRVSEATGIFEVKYLEARRWMLIIQSDTGVRAQFVHLTRDGHIVDEATGRPLWCEKYHELRREAIAGMLKIVAVKEEGTSANSASDEPSRLLGYRRGHYRNVGMCHREALQTPPAEIGYPDRRGEGFTWVRQVNPN